MEDKDLKDTDLFSKYEDSKENTESLHSNVMDELDSLTHSLDDAFIDFEKEIEALDRRANKTLAEYGINKGENNKISDLPLDNQTNTSTSKLTSFEKAQELIDNISSSSIFEDTEPTYYTNYSSDYDNSTYEKALKTLDSTAPKHTKEKLVNEEETIKPTVEDVSIENTQDVYEEAEPVEEINTPSIENKKEDSLITPIEINDSLDNKEIKIVEDKSAAEVENKHSDAIDFDLNQMIESIQDKVQQASASQETTSEQVKEVEEEKSKPINNKVDENNSIIEKEIEHVEQETKTELNNLQKESGKKKFDFGFKKKKTPKAKAIKIAGGGNGNNNNNGGKRKKTQDGRPKGSKLTFAFAIIACIVLFLGIVGGCGALWFANRLCINKPEFSAADLESADSSIIYDSKGNQVIELGLYLRENIEYDELPNCVIDAFVSIEDSRYFEHFGFDIPRFTKAIIENLKSGSFAQGGSTITMQLVKNSYFQVDNDEDSTMAARSGMSGVQRKMQEIVLAMEADHALSKQEIFVLFLNKVNFGDNIRGIQKAAEYYFGKDARELELNEAAFLAGIINAPNVCNPYNEIEKRYGNNVYLSEDINYLENANIRKNEVLDLMAYHGYITDKEATINKAVKIENLVAGKSKKFGNTNTYYQSYIDAVITEAQKVTGKNPYTTAMNIYTTMDPHLQEFVYDMQNNPEKFKDKYVFRHENQQNALVIMNNQTGELIALGGGRFQADEARQFNRAVDSYINPGSSIKPVIEYVLAFDKLGYATSHTITDQPVFLYETDIVVSNAYGQGYTGDMLITEALARSLNTPAIQLMNEVIDKIGEDEVIKYCQSIGLDWCNKDTFDIQWAIGGKDCLVSPVQLAGAHGMIIHGGKYVAPHCIQKIEYRGKYNETPDFIADTEGVQVVSPAAAYMTATLLRNNVTSGWIGQLNLLKRDYPTFAKTGTTNFSEAAYINYNIPETAAKDQWVCCQSPNYTIVVWNGFDKLEDNAYFTVTDENYNLKCKMGSMLLDEVMNTFNYDPQPLVQPDDCIEISHIRGCFPYAIGNGVTGLISKNSPYATPIPESQVVKERKGGTLYHTVVLDAGDGNATIHWDEFNAYGEGTIDMSVTSVSGKKTVIAFGRSYYPRYNFVNPGGFFATLTTGDGQEIAVESPTPTITVETGAPGPYSVCGWTASNPNPRCSSQTK